MRPLYLCSCGPPGGHALAYLRNSLLCLSLLGQHPAPIDSSPPHPVRKSLLDRECNGCLCPLSGQLPLPTELVEFSSKVQGSSQAEGVRYLLGQPDSLVASLQGLIWIAKMPQGKGGKVQAHHPGVYPIEEGQGTVLLKVVEGNALLQVRSGRDQFSQHEQRFPKCPMGRQQESWVLHALG